MSQKIVLACLLASSLALSACGKKEPKAPAPDATGGGATADASGMSTEEQLQKQAEETRKTLAQANGGKEIKAVETKDLKAILPESIGKAKRSNAEAQHVNMGGMDMSMAKADYNEESESDPRPSYRVEVNDLGNLSGAALTGMTMWAVNTVDRETDHGYEKSTKYKGYATLEEYDNQGKSGQMQIFVAKRFIVKVSGNDATIDQIHGAADAVDLSKLASLGK